MKIQVFFLSFFLLILSLPSCRNENSPSMNWIKTFEGKIGDKLSIIAKFECNKGKISGNYYYESKGQEILVQGDLSANGSIEIKEFDTKGNQTGVFRGKTVGENRIEGTWSKPNGNDQTSFYLLVTNTQYETVKDKFKELKSIEGRYESPFNEGGISSGDLIIRNVRADKFDFEITVAHAMGCTGEVKGTATINTDKVGIYSSRDCKELKFEFYDKEARVSENGCMGLHGIRCSFDGTYNKKF